LDKNAVAAINELAASLKIILEQGGSLRKAMVKFFKGTVTIEVEGDKANLVKLSEAKNVKKIILEHLGMTGLFNYEDAVEDWNADRDSLTKARLTNLQNYQRCEVNIRRSIEEVNGDGKDKDKPEVTAVTTVKKVVVLAKKAKTTKKAQSKFIDDVIVGLKEAKANL
jgi:chorismate-pyruvate lyase